jgi:hypothetical protein
MPSAPPAQRTAGAASAAFALALGAALLVTGGTAFAQKGPSEPAPTPQDVPGDETAPVDSDAMSFAEGLQPMIDRLAATDTLSDADRFTLAGAQFLRGIELALQTRYRVGATRGIDMLPVLRLELAAQCEPGAVFRRHDRDDLC